MGKRRRRTAMRTVPLAATAVAAALAMGGLAAVAGNLKRVAFTDQFALESCSALATHTGAGPGGGARNRYFPLEVNRVLELSNAACVEAGECDELEEVRVTILDETEVVDGVTTRVLEERESVNGELAEVSRNFVVECVGTEDVYYFGEDVVDGDGLPLGGAWRAGEGDARPGIIFPGGAFLLGARYFQEVAPGVALDRAEHKAMGLEFDENGFHFEDCVLIEDTNGLSDPAGKSPDAKIYCPGVGIVMDEELSLVNIIDP
jgi:hypothetical protein